MNFKSLASSSKGNCYLVESGGVAPLLLECGIPVRRIREGLNFGLSGLAGCLVSHEHGDHSKAVKDLLKAGVDCYMSHGTATALGASDHHRVNLISKTPNFNVGAWRVRYFPLEHDAAEPTGFFIEDIHGDTCLFIPDTAFVRNRFLGVNILAIEANNIEEILSRNIVEGNIPAVVGRRVRRSHMSLERVIVMLKANDLSQCREIWLLHLSDGNSDENEMRSRVQEATGIATYIAS
jgi:phosphoribosyl 1,2-cyclic phosphodiesterase